MCFFIERKILLWDHLNIFLNCHQNQQELLNIQLSSQSDAMWYGNKDKIASPKRQVEGLKPHSIISIDKLTPFTLGQLIALYEYRTIFSAWLWQINCFDQPGVELGKILSRLEH